MKCLLLPLLFRLTSVRMQEQALIFRLTAQVIAGTFVSTKQLFSALLNGFRVKTMGSFNSVKFGN